MLADYYIIRKTELDAEALYQTDGEFAYGGSGFNWRALVALACGIAPNVPGFVAQVSDYEAPAIFANIYTYAFFVSLAIAAAMHTALTTMFPAAGPARAGATAPGEAAA